MKTHVNKESVDILPGMTIRHALMSAGALEEMGASKKVYDAWGNEVGLHGVLSEGMKIYVKNCRT